MDRGRAVLGSVLPRTYGLSLFSAAFFLLVTTQALAFCRQTSCVETTELVCDKFEDPDDCHTVEHTCAEDAQGCVIDGALLHRTSPCLSFAVARGNGSAFGLTDDQFAAIVLQAFERWSSVDCGGGQKPGFNIQSAGLVVAKSPHFCAEVSLNTSTWFLSRPWTSDGALLANAVTTSGVANAEIFDADVELNVDKILRDFPGADHSEVLLAVVTHEAGHFLGLAHSPEPQAVMYEGYSRGLAARPLTEDDIQGICEIFPPESAPSECSAPGVAEAGLEKTACAAAMQSTDPEKEPEGTAGSGNAARGCSVASLSPRANARALGACLLIFSLGWIRRRRAV